MVILILIYLFQLQHRPARSPGREPWRWQRRERSVRERFPGEPARHSGQPEKEKLVATQKMKYQLKVVKVEDSAELVAFVPLCAVFSPHLMLVPSWETLKDTRNICRSNCLVLADHQQLSWCELLGHGQGTGGEEGKADGGAEHFGGLGAVNPAGGIYWRITNS